MFIIKIEIKQIVVLFFFLEKYMRFMMLDGELFAIGLCKPQH